MSPLLALLMVTGAAAGERRHASEGGPATVVFVCQHGNVKSLIASQWFNRLATARGMAARAVSRGVTPEASVPAAIVEQLGRDGFDVARHEPLALSPADLDGAIRVVIIGVEPPAWIEDSGLPIETWDGIPPATERYGESRDAMRDRISALLDALASRGREP